MTLVELLVSITVGGVIMAGVMSAFLLLGRSGVNAANYSVTASEASQGMETFAQDVRMASGIVWNSTSSITLTVPDNYAGYSNRVTYAYESNPASSTYQCFYQMPGTAADSNPRRVLIRHVSSLTFSRFNRLNAAAANNAETKRIQVDVRVTRETVTATDATQTVVAASHVLRNKVAN